MIVYRGFGSHFDMYFLSNCESFPTSDEINRAQPECEAAMAPGTMRVMIAAIVLVLDHAAPPTNLIVCQYFLALAIGISDEI